MKHIKQEINECSLAVLAMVSGAKYTEVQTYAWCEFPMRIGRGYFPEQVKAIWSHFEVSYVEHSAYHEAPIVDLHKLSLAGHGHMIYKSAKMPIWHHIAYNHGWIHDALEPTALRLQYWVDKRALVMGESESFAKVVQRRLK